MNQRCANFVLNTPYPKLENIEPDAEAARRLLSGYAGSESELTAITQYFYNSLLAPLMGSPALGDLFACVSRVEMYHLELLGQLILAYGGDPGYLAYGRGGRTAWWTGAFVCYEKAPAKMLQNAIRDEQAAIENYRKTLTYLKNKSACSLIARMIADEEHHIALFTAALASTPMPLQS